MNILIDNNKDWREVFINTSLICNRFFACAEILENDFQIIFTCKLNDLETFYWDFKYKESELTLHYNIISGVSIFPKALKQATNMDNKNVIEIGELLSKIER